MHACVLFNILNGFNWLIMVGTTVKGALDDLDLVIHTLEESGFTHDRFYIHCDAALFGLMVPFVKCVSHIFQYWFSNVKEGMLILLKFSIYICVS